MTNPTNNTDAETKDFMAAQGFEQVHIMTSGGSGYYWTHRDLSDALDFTSDQAAFIYRLVKQTEVNLMRKHRRLFERLAEYADSKKATMDEYDDEIAYLEASLIQRSKTA